MSFKLKSVAVFSLILPLCMAYNVSFAQNTKSLQSLSDSELSDVNGQALMSLSYIAPGDAANKMPSQDAIGFYKLGLEADLELNANIKKLQLGCSGGNCDIDIDNLSFSGLGNAATSNTASESDRAARVGSSAVLTNPFIQFAIKNPDSAAKREIVGINLSSEKAMGLMTFGTENNATKNGINSLSGYMKVAATTGLAQVNGFGTSLVSGEAARGQLRQADGYDEITGKACCLFPGVPTSFKTTEYDLNLRDKATGSNILKGDLVLKEQVITGKRIDAAPLLATATVRDIDLSGEISARAVLGIISLNDRATSGTIQNLKVDVAIDQNLGFFHKADLNGTPASLSLQSQDLKWTGNNSVSQKGWWLELSDPIEIGQIDPALKVDIPKATLNEVMGQVSTFLDKNHVQCGRWVASECLWAGSPVPVGTVNLQNAPAASMPLKDIQLVKQAFTPNCYGNLKFC